MSLLVVAMLRRGIGLPPEAEEEEEAVAAADAEALRVREARWVDPDVLLRPARGLFYAGLVLLMWAALRPAIGMTFAQMLFIGSTGLCVLAALRGARAAPLPPVFLCGALLFALGGLISSVDAADPAGSVLEVIQGMFVIVMWAWTGAMVLRTRRQFAVAVGLWVGAASLLGLTALWQGMGIHFLTGSPEGSRMTGLMPHPNDLGGALAIALVPALAIASTRGAARRVPTSIRWLPVGAIATGLILAGSVGAMGAAAAGLAIWLGSPVVRNSTRLAVVGIAVSALLVSSFANATSPIERLEVVTSSPVRVGGGSGQERISLAEAAWPRIGDNPLVGEGMDNEGRAATVIAQRRQVKQQIHGLPVAIWYSAGIFGVLGLLLVFGSLAHSTIRNIRVARDRDEAVLGWALLGTFTAFLVNSMGGPASFQQYAWVATVFTIAWGLRVAAEGALRAQLAEGAPPGIPPWGRAGRAGAVAAGATLPGRG